MLVLVTGSSGFVGQHVVRELKARGYDVLTPTSRELNLVSTGYSDIDTLIRIEDYLYDHDVDAVIHLAAICGGIGINKDNPGKFIYENLQMGVNVLEGARLAGVKKVVNLGTVCMYPKHTPVPFKEEDIYNGYPEETNAPYGIAKRTIVEMGIAYHRQYGMDITNLIPVNMAGEYDNFDEYSSHVIPALIRKFEDAQAGAEYANHYVFGKELPTARVLINVPNVILWGTGSASREFLYAGDCAKAIAMALERNTGPEPINLGTGREITIRDLAILIKHMGGYDVAIEWDTTKPDGQPRRCIDTTRAREVLGWKATTSLETMLSKVIDWYRANRG